PVASDAELLCPPVRESIATIMMFVELGTPDDLRWVLDETRQTCKMVALDCDQKLPTSGAIVAQARASVSPDRLLLNTDNQAWFDWWLDMIQRIEQGVTDRTILLCGTGALADHMSFSLPRLGARVLRPQETASLEGVHIVVGAAQKSTSIDEALVE